MNLQNKNGHTGLHYAYQYSYLKLAEYLISKGADDSVRNNFDCLPHEGLGKASVLKPNLNNDCSDKKRGRGDG